MKGPQLGCALLCYCASVIAALHDGHAAEVAEMAALIGVVSQKGGVGKSTLARLIAREYAAAGWRVKIADLDISQGTSTDWKQRRERAGVAPEVAVEPFGAVAQALKVAPLYDLVIFDGQPHSMAGTLEIANASDAVILPTGLSLDDLKPSVLLAHELAERNVSAAKLAFVLCRVGDRAAEIMEARAYIRRAGYQALEGELPERTGYRRASDQGRALSESVHPTLRGRAERVAQSVIDFVATRNSNSNQAKKAG